MDRQIVYLGAIPQDTDFLQMQRNILIALGFSTQAALGDTAAVVGLAAGPTSPASMTVVISPGALTWPTTIDNLSFGSLSPITTAGLLKIGINIGSTTFALTAPSGTGQSQIYLIAATFSESYAGSQVLPYVNAADPDVPFSGPANDGAPQYTQIVETVSLQLVLGTAAATGSAVPPATPAGYVPLYYVTVPYGASSITSSNIAQAAGNPFIQSNLPALTTSVAIAQGQITTIQGEIATLTTDFAGVKNGYRNIVGFTSTSAGTWTAPAGINSAFVRVWGGGGAGGNGFTGAGGGGGGGGYAEGFVTLTPGGTYTVSVGNGGSGSGSAGGASNFNSTVGATGGAAGSNGSATYGVTTPGGTSGYGTEGGFVVPGAYGGYGMNFSASVLISGEGGAAGGSGGGGGPAIGCTTASTTANGTAGALPGGGGGGGAGAGTGGAGGAGLVIIYY